MIGYAQACRLCGQHLRPNLFQDFSKFRLRYEAHSSISVQEGQPNLSCRRFGPLISRSARRGQNRFRQQIKGLAEGGDHIAILPGAVR